MKAHILQGALENEGIESILHNENFSTLYKSCVSNIAGVDILVADEDYENAVQVLRDNDSWPEELTLCPYCGSSDIQLVLRKGKRWRALGAAIISALMVTPPEITTGTIPVNSVIKPLKCRFLNLILLQRQRNNYI